MDIVDNLKDFSKNLQKSLENGLEIIKEKQNSFLKSNIGQAINGGVDIGIRYICPDFLEDDIIEIKDAIITDGFKEGVSTAIDNAIQLGKEIKGIFTGNFENIDQINDVLKEGGLLDGVSNILDNAINWAKEKNIISKDTAKLLKSGKKEILNEVEDSIDNSLSEQVVSIEKINGYIEKWKTYYENEDFNNMEYQYKKIKENIEKIMPIENILKEARNIENLHELIKNNGKNFNLSEEEKALCYTM